MSCSVMGIPSGEDSHGDGASKTSQPNGGTMVTDSDGADALQVLACQRCSKLAKLQYPKCLELKLPRGPGSFCSQNCFKAAWSSHKSVHSEVSQNAFQAVVSASAGDDISEFFFQGWLYCIYKGQRRTARMPVWNWTGPLRPYPISPRRLVPDNIPQPEWASEGFADEERDSEWQKSVEIKTPAQIEKMRAACKGELNSRLPSDARCLGLNQFSLVFILSFMIVGWIGEPSLADTVINSDFSQLETRALRLGQERIEEKLPFREGGKCIYELMDMKEAHWYEVKISYPASTPAIFSIDFLPEHDDDTTFVGRKLLNTEKVIFHFPKGPASQDVHHGMKWRVLVSVRPEGFVAQPHVQEQALVIYNILLEEVVLGIPRQAFWVGFLGLISLCASAFAARQITRHVQPLIQLRRNNSTKRAL